MINPYSMNPYIQNMNYQTNYSVSQPVVSQNAAYYYPQTQTVQQIPATQVWQYQHQQGINNLYGINSVNNNIYYNFSLGNKLLNEFNSEYPNLASFTMCEILAKRMEKENPTSLETSLMKAKADRYFELMIGLLQKRPDQYEQTFDEYINMVKQEFKEYNHGNCGERAYIIHDKLNKMGIKNQAVIEISGNKASNSHVFNVIGLAPCAIKEDPRTWGENAIIVDTWANKVFKPQEGLAFYTEFLGYSQNNPIKFENLDINKLFKTTI